MKYLLSLLVLCLFCGSVMSEAGFVPGASNNEADDIDEGEFVLLREKRSMSKMVRRCKSFCKKNKFGGYVHKQSCNNVRNQHARYLCGKCRNRYKCAFYTHSTFGRKFD